AGSLQYLRVRARIGIRGSRFGRPEVWKTLPRLATNRLLRTTRASSGEERMCCFPGRGHRLRYAWDYFNSACRRPLATLLDFKLTAVPVGTSDGATVPERALRDALRRPRQHPPGRRPR